MTSEPLNPYKIIFHKESIIGRFHIVQDKIDINGKYVPFSYSKLCDCVCILPIVGNKVVLIREYRHPLREWIWGCPAGAIIDGEKYEDAAKRELQEETGYLAKKMHYLGKYPLSPGTSTLQSHLYIAECTQQIKQELDETEYINVYEVTPEEFEEMIINGEFKFLMGIVMWYFYKKIKT